MQLSFSDLQLFIVIIFNLVHGQNPFILHTATLTNSCSNSEHLQLIYCASIDDIWLDVYPPASRTTFVCPTFSAFQIEARVAVEFIKLPLWPHSFILCYCSMVFNHGSCFNNIFHFFLKQLARWYGGFDRECRFVPLGFESFLIPSKVAHSFGVSPAKQSSNNILCLNGQCMLLKVDQASSTFSNRKS